MTKAESSLPDYESIDAVFVAQGVSMSPAEVHGILAGVLCLPNAANVDWLELILATDGNTALSPGKEFSGIVLDLFRRTNAQLSGSDFDFTLLLPDQDTDVLTRAEALAAWSRGLLLGISATGLTAENCSDTVREILGDIVELSGIETREENAAEAERAMIEIEEYLRVATRLLKEELSGAISG